MCESTLLGWANAADIRRQAAELVALAPDVILGHGTPTLGPLLQVSRTVPIVFAAYDRLHITNQDANSTRFVTLFYD